MVKYFETLEAAKEFVKKHDITDYSFTTPEFLEKGVDLNFKTIYEEKGYTSRKEYLESLADEYGVDFGIVAQIAQIYGPAEDFDGLISALEDYTMNQDGGDW